jgi:hypothetical protein
MKRPCPRSAMVLCKIHFYMIISSCQITSCEQIETVINYPFTHASEVKMSVTLRFLWFSFLLPGKCSDSTVKWDMAFPSTFFSIYHTQESSHSKLRNLCSYGASLNKMVYIYVCVLWSSAQSSWLQIQRSRVRLPALPDFLRSSRSGTGST